MPSGLALRWTHRLHAWRHRSEGGFDRRRYDVAELPDDCTARAFVETHHYSASFPVARLRYGLYRGPHLEGVAVLGVPARARVLTRPFPDLVPYAESLVLSRFVLLDAVPANAESWMLARVFALARRRGLHGVLSFSDPVPRRRADGTAVMPGHVGLIYQASNAVHLVRATRKDGTPASLQDDVLAVVRGWRERAAMPPVFVKASVEFNPHPIPGVQAKFVRQVGGQAHFVVMPVFARTFTGRRGQLRRQCTGDYKLEPIYRWLRPFIGRPPGIRGTKPPFVEMWIGISAEERATRCKPSVHAWVDNRWPLRELGMTRRDCAKWAWDAYRTVFPKSACLACPFHDDQFWAWLRAYHQGAWAEAVAFDREIRRLPMVQGKCYLHCSCLPLDEVPLTPEDRGQRDFLDLLDLHDACAFH